MENIDSEIRSESDPQNIDEIIELYQSIHDYRLTDDLGVKENVLKRILSIMESKGMSTWYDSFCESIGAQPKSQDLVRIQAVQKHQLAEIESSNIFRDSKIDALTDEAVLKKISYLFYSGETENAYALVNSSIGRSISEAFKVEICFLGLRFALFMKESSLASEYLRKANQIFENYTNWEQKNRLSVYEGLHNVSCAKYSTAIECFLPAMSTYRSPELMRYEVFLSFTVILALATLDRPLLKMKIIEQSELTAVLQRTPATYLLLRAFDECIYKDIFGALADVCKELMINAFFHGTVQFISEEIEIRAFNQYLEAYQTVSISSMAAAFGLEETVLEKKLFQRISDERVFCQIDKVAGHVISNLHDAVSSSYQKILRKGGILQNKLQALSRVIGV